MDTSRIHSLMRDKLGHSECECFEHPAPHGQSNMSVVIIGRGTLAETRFECDHKVIKQGILMETRTQAVVEAELARCAESIDAQRATAHLCRIGLLKREDVKRKLPDELFSCDMPHEHLRKEYERLARDASTVGDKERAAACAAKAVEFRECPDTKRVAAAKAALVTKG